MRILHTVECYPPSVGGMQEHVRQISERLAAMGHQVTVATAKMKERVDPLMNRVRIAEFGVDGNAVNGIIGEGERYQDYLLTSDFDVITNFAAQQWATDLALPILEKIRAKKVFVPTGFSGLYLPQYRDYFESMKSWLHRYDMNIFLSEDYRDIHFARDCGVNKRVVIPNGAGADEFLEDSTIDFRRLLGLPPHQFLVLHVGSHTGMKGHAETLSIFAGARIQDAVLVMIGNTFSEHCRRDCLRKARLFNAMPGRLFDRKKIIITDLLRRETVAAFKEADLFLFPSWVECSPLVLFECMASKTPFMTTDVGNAAEIVRWSGSAGIIMPTQKDAHGYSRANTAESARLLEQLYRNPARRTQMQQAGFDAWQERFTWETIAGEYEKVYLNLLSCTIPAREAKSPCNPKYP